MLEKNKKRQIAKTSIFIMSIFVIFMSITYAFVTQVLIGEKGVVISAGVLDLVLEEENAITISDALPMYDEVGMIQEDVFKFRLVNKTSNPTSYVLKLSKINADNELSPSDVKYYLTKEGVGEPKLLSSLPTDGTVDSGTIEGNDTIDYTLRLWIDSNVTDNIKIEGKSLSYKMDVEVKRKMLHIPATSVEKIVDESAVGENCKTYNDGVDTFLVGQCSNNYVWYSGKLWRVVLKNNETGAVKMVTDNAITAITYNAGGNTTFENSYVDQWLNQEFLPTLHNYKEYLVVDSQWDASYEESYGKVAKGNTILTRTVGLLNVYEYYTTYNKSDGLATNSTGYLKNNATWWLITPKKDSISNIWYVDEYGNNPNAYCHLGYGVRPAINVNSVLKIKSGMGTIDNPYKLEDDEQVTINGTTLLSTRYSGEYITFNNELYRIVGVEENLTKITAVYKPTSLSKSMFHSVDAMTNFVESDIKLDLENYYQNLNSKYKTMIEPNTNWYLGKIADGTNYKATICKTVDVNVSATDCVKNNSPSVVATANVSLPRVGEMFASSITREKVFASWTLTPYDKYGVRVVGTSMYRSVPTASIGARPSMYLKSNVVIASNNTGNGTYEKPYSIELGQ